MPFRMSCIVASALGVVATTLHAQAQVASISPSPASYGWTFTATPYAWLPRISSTLDVTGPRGSSVTNNVDAGVGDYISDVNFGLMAGGEARYDRFSIMTDLIYSNLSLTTADSHLSSVNLRPGSIEIPRESQLSTGARSASTIWSLAGGYTVLRGDWGNLDAVAGMRVLFLNSKTNYTLDNNIFAPDGTIALSRTGSLNLNLTEVDGVGGITGRINIPHSKFYLPFYLDAGGGAVPFTWQAYGGVAYKAWKRADISLGYRYLSFQAGGQTGVQNFDLGGVLLATSVRF